MMSHVKMAAHLDKFDDAIINFSDNLRYLMCFSNSVGGYCYQARACDSSKRGQEGIASFIEFTIVTNHHFLQPLSLIR